MLPTTDLPDLRFHRTLQDLGLDSKSGHKCFGICREQILSQLGLIVFEVEHAPNAICSTFLSFVPTSHLQVSQYSSNI